MLPDIQSWTNAAARTLAPMRMLSSPQKYGTAVHLAVNQTIEMLKLQFPSRYYNIWSELSVLPDGTTSAEPNGASYGQKETTRLDVFERVDATTACVYDIKTGRRGLSMTRVAEFTTRSINMAGLSTVFVVQVNPE